MKKLDTDRIVARSAMVVGIASGATEPDKAVIVTSYESVYGERWRVRSDRMVPERLP